MERYPWARLTKGKKEEAEFQDLDPALRSPLSLLLPFHKKGFICYIRSQHKQVLGNYQYLLSAENTRSITLD